jgi:hypothetical protein
MIRLRVVVATLIAVCLFAWADVLIWQRLVEGREWLPAFDGRYHDGWRVMRDALIIVGLLLLEGRWLERVFFAGTLFLFSVNGVVDVLYYWLDGRGLPVDFAWPCDAWHICWGGGTLGRDAFLLNIALWTALWIALWSAMPLAERILRRYQAEREKEH